MDAHVSQVVEQVTEVPKTSSRDRTVQCTVEKILDVPVPEMVKQLVEVPKTVSQDRIQQRTVKQEIVGVPVPQVVEELVEVFNFSPPGQDLNSTLWSRPSKLLPCHSLRRSLRCLPLRRKKRLACLARRQRSRSGDPTVRR